MVIDFVVRRRVVEVQTRILVPKPRVECGLERRGVSKPAVCCLGVAESRRDLSAIQEDLLHETTSS